MQHVSLRLDRREGLPQHDVLVPVVRETVFELFDRSILVGCDLLEAREFEMESSAGGLVRGEHRSRTGGGAIASAAPEERKISDGWRREGRENALPEEASGVMLLHVNPQEWFAGGASAAPDLDVLAGLEMAQIVRK